MASNGKNRTTIVRDGRPLSRLLAVIATALTLAGALSVGTAPAGSPLKPDDHCGQGDVTAIKNAYYPLWSTGWGSPASAPNLCQFRTFYQPPEGICFCELDMFVGGDVWSEPVASPYFPGCRAGDEGCLVPYDGWTARESVGLEEEVTTFLDPAGLPIERFVTPVRGWKDPDGVRLVLKQTGVVFRNLPPGGYTVSTELYHPALVIFGNVFGTPWVVTFHVLPHDQAHELGRPTGEFTFGSVKCPADVQ